MKHNRGRLLLFGIGIMVASAVPILSLSAEELPRSSESENPLTAASRSLKPETISSGLQFAIVIIAVSVVPVLVLMTTGFIRIIVVLSLVRHGLGSQYLPPTSVVMGLSLLLTIVVMTPVWEQTYQSGIAPLLNKECTSTEAVSRALAPVRAFMLRNVRSSDLRLFCDLKQLHSDLPPDQTPTRLLVPSFVISELNTAFQMGFRILLPFLIIDMVVASALVSLGVFMLPPAMVSLPFKLLLFVLADGWRLVVGALFTSFS